VNTTRTVAAIVPLLLCGCSETMRQQQAAPAADPTSRRSMVEPDFFAQPRPAADDTSPQRPRSSSLVSLYGELQVEPGPSRGGTWDGSSNVTQESFAVEGACADPDVNHDGTWMVFSSTQHSSTWDIYLKPIPGRTMTQLTTDPADDIMPAFDASGERVAFASNRTGNFDIYVMSLAGGQPMKVTDEPDNEIHPCWSPDGKRLIYSKLGTKSGRWEMWVVDTENPGVRRFLDYGLFPQWCPDPARSKILFQRARQRGSRYFGVWTVDVVGGDAVHPTEIISAGNAAIINPSWSPDGSRIVFVTVVEPGKTTDAEPVEQSDIWISTLDGAGRTNLTNGRYANYQPEWSADGRVYFVSNRTGTENVWSVSTSRAMDAIESRPARVTTAMPGGAEMDRAGRP
jgi:TolB protein